MLCGTGAGLGASDQRYRMIAAFFNPPKATRMIVSRIGAIGAMCFFVASCGGGGGGGSTSTSVGVGVSTPPQVIDQGQVNADQTLFESFFLASRGGASTFIWELPPTGLPSDVPSFLFNYYVYNTNYALAASPAAAGPQVITAPRQLFATSLRPLSQFVLPTSMYLLNGTLVRRPDNTSSIRYSYEGSGVFAERLAEDQKTVVTKIQHRDLVAVPLTGLLSDTPAELKKYLRVFFQNPSLLKAGATWQSGAAYLKMGSRAVGDTYQIYDCYGSSAGPVPNPCRSNTNLADYIAGASSITTSGKFVTVQGVKAWIKNDQVASMPGVYDMYVEMNGNIFPGLATKDGADSYFFRYDGLSTTWHPHFNDAAVKSFRAALTVQ